MKTNKQYQKGLSLIEIMVALTISTFIMLGIFQVFIGTSRSNNLGSSLARVQETGRFALDYMVRDLRLVGYQGCIDNEAVDIDILSNAGTGVTSNLDASELQGFRILADSSWNAAKPAEFGADPTGTMQTLSDVIYVQHASAQSFSVNSAVTASGGTSSIIPLSAAPTGVASGDVMIITNCESADMFTVGSVSGTDVTVTTSDNSALFTAVYDEGDADANRSPAEVISFETRAFYIKDTGRNNSRGDAVFGLYQLDPLTGLEQEIVEGVERLEVAYGQELNTGNIRYVPITDGNLDLDEVDRLRISVLVTSNEPVLQSDDASTYQMLNLAVVGSGAAPTYNNADRRLRRVFSTSFVMRNRAR